MMVIVHTMKSAELIRQMTKEAEIKFTIAIEPGTKKTAFGIVVPDLPGCFSAGDTVEEAFDNAREIIDAFCQILAEKGKDLPVPKSMSKWRADKEYKGWTWGIV
jgi:predicted RNase H-like HicB family nuclease